MSSRVLIFSLVALIGLAVLTHPLISQNPQSPIPKWEYKVTRADSALCSSENELSTALNVIGQDGWELVSYERFAAPFPRDAEGTILLKPAATGPGAQTQPQTADSFTGNITMRLAQTAGGACRFLFKRQAKSR